jgi:histidinol phosphatase-like PHP family hydrolase
VIDLRYDAHVHTAFSGGRDSVSVLVSAGEKAGLSGLTFADLVGPDSAWLASYRASIHRASQRTELTLRCGVEVEAIGTDGWLAFPTDLGGLEVISVGLSRLPLPAGPVGPEVVRSLLLVGAVSSSDVIEQLVTITCLAVERVARYAPTLLARPLSFLTRAGIDDADVPDQAIAALVEACRSHGTVVEVSERYRMPSIRMVRAFAAAGVAMVAASDARSAAEVGGWAYATEVAAVLAGLDSRPPATR